MKLEVEVIPHVSGYGVRSVKINGREAFPKHKWYSCRAVARCGEYMIKVETEDEFTEIGPYATNQNGREWERWHKLKPKDRKGFAPCIDLIEGDNYTVLIQKYIKGRICQAKYKQDKMIEKAMRLGMDLWDLGKYNLKETPEGDLVIVDYGVGRHEVTYDE